MSDNNTDNKILDLEKLKNKIKTIKEENKEEDKANCKTDPRANDPKLEHKKVPVKEFVLDFVMGYVNNDLSNLSCQVSFRFLLGIFPFLLFLIIFFASLNLDTSYLKDQMDALPDFTVQLLSAFVTDISTNTAPVGLMSTTFILAIYSSSKAFKTVIEAVNKIYYGEVRMPVIKRYVLSILFVLLFFCLIILPLVYYIFADAIWAILGTLFNIESHPLSATNSAILFACMVTYLTILVMLMYGMSLGKTIKLRTTLPGAILCVASWWISSYGFNFYVTNISNYSKVYGSIGTVILFFLWINIITLVLLVGSLVNKIIYTYSQENRRLIYRALK